jgi:hypothetical protein
MTDDRKLLWPWIAAVLIGLPVLYVASFGPACLVFSDGLVSFDQLNYVYRPLIRLTFYGPEIVQQSFRTYVRFWHGEKALVTGYILDRLDV